MTDFDPEALARLQSEEIEITIPRAVASLIACFFDAAYNAELPTSDEASNAASIEDWDFTCDIVRQLSNFGRTGINHHDACFCVFCGQPDEPALHDQSKCGAFNGELSVALIERAPDVSA